MPFLKETAGESFSVGYQAEDREWLAFSQEALAGLRHSLPERGRVFPRQLPVSSLANAKALFYPDRRGAGK